MMMGQPNLHWKKHWPISSANLWVCSNVTGWMSKPSHIGQIITSAMDIHKAGVHHPKMCMCVCVYVSVVFSVINYRFFFILTLESVCCSVYKWSAHYEKMYFSHILSKPKVGYDRETKEKKHSIKGHVQLSGQQVWTSWGQECTPEPLWKVMYLLLFII